MQAVLIDYTGTILKVNSPDMNEMIRLFQENSLLTDPKQIIAWWFRSLRELEKECYLGSYVTEDELCMKLR